MGLWATPKFMLTMVYGEGLCLFARGTLWELKTEKLRLVTQVLYAYVTDTNKNLDNQTMTFNDGRMKLCPCDSSGRRQLAANVWCPWTLPCAPFPLLILIFILFL